MHNRQRHSRAALRRTVREKTETVLCAWIVAPERQQQSVAAADCIGLGASSSPAVFPFGCYSLSLSLHSFSFLSVGRDHPLCPRPRTLTHVRQPPFKSPSATIAHLRSPLWSPAPFKPPGKPFAVDPAARIFFLSAGATGIAAENDRLTLLSFPLSFSSRSWFFHLFHHTTTLPRDLAILLQTCFFACLCCSY